MGPRGGGGLTFTAVVMTAFAVACCAGLPAILAVFGGVTLAAVLGVAGGLVAVIAGAGFGFLLVRGRRRRSCPPISERSDS